MKHFRAIFRELGFDVEKSTLPEGGLVYALARTYNLVMQQLAPMYRRFGLSAAGFNLLVLLKRGAEPETFTQRELSRRLVVSPSDMTGLVDRMEHKDLVRRIPGNDRRSKLLRITDKGSALVEEVWPHHAEVIKRMTEKLSSAEGEALMRALSLIREAVGV